jgi:hypothetical protein
VQAEGAVALRQGRGGEGAEQVGGVHGGLFWVALKQCGFVWLVGRFGGFVFTFGNALFLARFYFPIRVEDFSCDVFALARQECAINGDGG